jgi:hypothetical protein
VDPVVYVVNNQHCRNAVLGLFGRQKAGTKTAVYSVDSNATATSSVPSTTTPI